MASSETDRAFRMAVQHHQAGKLRDAETLYRQVLATQQNNAAAKNNLGIALSAMAAALAPQGALDEAIAAYREAISLRPDVAALHNNLAIVLIDAGQVDDARAHFIEAIKLDPNNPLFASAALCCLHYRSADDQSTVTAEHLAWNAKHAVPLQPAIKVERVPKDRLRIGYVSRDFRDHAVGRFLLPLLENHDLTRFEIFCYSDVPIADAVTARFQSAADQWRDITKLNHDQAAKLVRGDAIDILVDLAGHTTGNRLPVFARKPAPVQVSYLGYPATTGLSAIDYRLTDALADPPGSTEHLHSEKLHRLPQTNWCFGEPANAPPIERVKTDPITFGSFNNIAKLTDETLQIWGKILQQIPSSHLLLKAAGLVSKTTCKHILQTLAAMEIDPARVELLGPQPDHTSHLATYNRLDIALDTFPYHGTTTTCDAFWMGVPVITLAGQTHVSRVGVSLLSSVGLSDLIAGSEDQVVQLAVKLANARDRLKYLRSTLRQQMKLSPLMDAKRFARDVEGAYRTLWNA